ncbi:MAG: methyltransferase domain-containing protein [Bacteroidetes bacterium]|nr:methyltransferase domain-containing protein [Bacteroidota bacterium]
MAYIDFIEKIHKKTTRDYLGERVIGVNKAECAKIAKKFDFNYWDGDRKYGYGGFQYDGRWRPVADQIVKHYNLKSGQKILDVGCGKAYLLFEFSKSIPGIEVFGLDISKYALDNAKEEMMPFLKLGNAIELPYKDKSFDLVLSINTLHNLDLPDIEKALKEIERVGKVNKYIVLDSYRTEEEKVNLMYWQLTCECFYTPKEWEWIFNKCGYSGDYSCIFYE